MDKNKIEQYLIESMYSYHEAGEGLWVLDDTEHNLEGITVAYADPLVICRVVVMEAPEDKPENSALRLGLFGKLLELNANDVVYGAYAIEEGNIVLVNSMNYATLDYSEFHSTLDAFSLALIQHYPLLSQFRNANKGGVK
jgi:hypothetical protein